MGWFQDVCLALSVSVSYINFMFLFLNLSHLPTGVGATSQPAGPYDV